MNSKIYVGNILYEVTDQDLRDLFSPYGEIQQAEVVRYQKSKRSKGFGFVRMATVEQAQAAVQALNDSDYKGRKLFLDYAKSEDPTADVREKQQTAAQGAIEKKAASFTPINQPVKMLEPETIPHEELEIIPAPEILPAAPLPQPKVEPEVEVAPEIAVEEVHPEMSVEAPAPEPEPQPQPEEKPTSQPLRSFGTIFSNSPSRNEETNQ